MPARRSYSSRSRCVVAASAASCEHSRDLIHHLPLEACQRSATLRAIFRPDACERHKLRSPRRLPLHKIAVLPGDGTGPEVVDEALKVLNAASKVCGFKYETTPFDFGGDRYLRTGEVLPETATSDLRGFDAILLGAIGHPDVKPGILEKGILLRLRFELDLYINLRPVKLYPGVETPLAGKGPEHIDFVVVRENTEGLYAGAGGNLRRGTQHEVAVQESINTRMGVERCLRYAFDYTRKRNQRKTLTLCGKTNVLTYAFDLWERAFHEIGDADYKD